jgi:tetratricopeptide (TPR) repeat protein
MYCQLREAIGLSSDVVFEVLEEWTNSFISWATYLKEFTITVTEDRTLLACQIIAIVLYISRLHNEKETLWSEDIFCDSDSGDSVSSTKKEGKQNDVLYQDYLKYIQLSGNDGGSLTFEIFADDMTSVPVIAMERSLEETICSYEEKVKEQKTKYSPKHIVVGKTLEAMANMHHELGNNLMYIRYLQEALVVLRFVLGEDHAYVAETMFYIGLGLCKDNRFTDAMESLTVSLRTYQKNDSEEGLKPQFQVFYYIGFCHEKFGNYTDAIANYLEALRIQELVWGSEDSCIFMTLYTLGDVYKDSGNLDKALEYFEKALKNQKARLLNADPVQMADTLNEIGNIHLAFGNLVAMMEAFNDAKRIYRNAGLNPDSQIVSESTIRNGFEITCMGSAPAA